MSQASHMAGRLRALYRIVLGRMRFLNERLMHPPVGRPGSTSHGTMEQLEPRLLLSGQGFDFPGEVPPEYEVGSSPRSVAAADFDGDGAVDLVTANASSDTVSVLRNLGDGTFAAQVAYAVGSDPLSVAAVDFDGDGSVDLVTANSSSNTVSVLRNLGDGTFAAQVTYAVGTAPYSVTAADFNGDGAVDLVTGNSSSNTVSVLRNLGDGTFAAQVTYAVGSKPYSVSAADFDGDGAVDLVTANSTSTTVSVLRNLGDGTFAAQSTYAVGSSPHSVVAADFDGDGAMDLVTANYSSNTVSVLRNLGDGTFATQVAYPVGGNPESVAAADVDGDGSVDLVTANYSSNTVSVLQNLGNGTFAEQVTYAERRSPYSVAAADFDGDGAVDLVTPLYYFSTAVLRNLGDGTFPAKVVGYAVGSYPYSVAGADFDGDGAMDLVTANLSSNTISVLRNLGDGTFAAQATYAVGRSPHSVVAADLDGDGSVDLVTANSSSNTVSVLRNLGDGTFAAEMTYAVGSYPYSVTAADVDDDGALDLVTANASSDTVSVLRNLGDGTFASQMIYAVGITPRSVSAADFDGDGAVDLVTANYYEETVSVLRNLGDGTFAAQVTYAVGSYPQSVAAADVDGDGAMDLVTAHYSSNTVSVLWNLGDGTFAAQVAYPVGDGPGSVTAADVDDDGALDLVTANSGSSPGTISVLRNLGDGTFGGQVTYVVGGWLNSVTATDVNGDGAVDLVTTNSSSNGVSVLRNLGNGTFAEQATYPVGSAPYAVTAADIDGDGAVDLVATNYWSNTVSVLRNLGDGTFVVQATCPVGKYPVSVAAADFDGDGAVDLVTANHGSNTVSVLRNLGDGTFAAQVTYPVTDWVYSVAAADIDGDGAVDLVTANYRFSSIVSVLRNRGDGTFAAPVTYAIGKYSQSVKAADLDGDGAVDLVTANASSDTVSVLRNLGDGTFAAQVAYPVGDEPWSVMAADVDNDGALDLVTANASSDTVSVLRNLGDGTFAAQVTYAVGGLPYSVTAADVDGDGAVDLVTANCSSSTVSVLRNLGDGTFAVQVTYAVGGSPESSAVGSNPYSVAAADFDGDGSVDLVTANYSCNTVSVLPNLGSGSSSRPADLAVTSVSVVSDSVTLGQGLCVTYEADNRGRGQAAGRWFDSIYLSADNHFDAADHLLGRIIHEGDLERGQSYTRTVDVMVPYFPGFIPGEWYVLVRTDVGDDVAETDTANNSGASEPFTIDQQVTDLTFDQPFEGTIAAGQSLYFQAHYAQGEPLAFLLDGLPTHSTVELFFRGDGLPSRSMFDRASRTPFVAAQYIYLPPQAHAGVFYIMVYAPTLASSPASFELTASVPEFGIRTRRFGTGGTSGDYTIQVVGADLDRTVTARLTNADGADLPAKAYWYESQTRMYATFDLRGIEPGVYDVAFTNSQGAVVTVPGSLTVVAASDPSPVVARVIAPSSIRRGGEFSFTVEWTNNSLNDAIAPLLTVGSSVPFGVEHNDYSLGTEYTFLGTNTQGGPAGILRPGQRETITFWAYSDIEPGEYNVFVDRMGVPDRSLNVETLRADLKPSDLTDPEYAPVFAQFLTQVGTSWSTYLATLSRNASLLPMELVDVRDSYNAARLEIRKASAAIHTSLTGQVFARELSVGLAGQQILARETTTNGLFVTTTLADGTFIFDDIAPGSYVFQVEGAVVQNASPTDVDDGAHILGVQVQLERGAFVSGTVHASPGDLAVSGAQVTLLDAAGDVADLATTDESGRYSLRPVGPGDYLLQIAAAGKAMALQQITVGSDDVVADASLAGESRITGQIVTEDEPSLADEAIVSVRRTDSALPYGLFAAKIDQGILLIDQLPSGIYDISIRLDGYQTVEMAAVTVGLAGTVDLGTIDVELAGSVAGSVTHADPTGDLTSLMVSAFLDGTRMDSAQVEASGHYEIGGLAPGIYELRVEGARFATTQTVSVVKSATPVVADLTVLPGGAIEGTVVDGSGDPVVGAPVKLINADGTTGIVVTGSAGAYSFSELDLGLYTVAVGDGLAGSGGSIEVTQLDGTPVSLPLVFIANARLSGRVRTSGGAAMPNASVVLLLTDQVVATAVTDAAGDYRFDILGPGTYQVQAFAAGGSFLPVNGVSIVDGASPTVDFTAGSSSLAVDVAQPGGGDINATLLLYQVVSGSFELVDHVEVLSEGTFVFDGLVGGDYLVMVVRADGVSGSATASLGDNEAGSAAVDVADQLVYQGVVTSGGSGVQGMVTLIRSGSPGLTFTVPTDESGGFSCEGLEPGVYDIIAMADGHEPLVQTDVSISSDADVVLDLNPLAATVTGVVQDAAGNPLGGASVTLIDASGRVIGIAATNSSGAFSIGALVGEAVTVLTTAMNFQPSTTALIVAAGANSVGVHGLEGGAVGYLPPPEILAAVARQSSTVDDAASAQFADPAVGSAADLAVASEAAFGMSLPDWLTQIFDDMEKSDRHVTYMQIPDPPAGCDCHEILARLYSQIPRQDLSWDVAKRAEDVLDVQRWLTVAIWTRDLAAATSAALALYGVSTALLPLAWVTQVAAPTIGPMIVQFALSVSTAIAGLFFDMNAAAGAPNARSAQSDAVKAVATVVKMKRSANDMASILNKLVGGNGLPFAKIVTPVLKAIDSLLFIVGGGLIDAINQMVSTSGQLAGALDDFEKRKQDYLDNVEVANATLDALRACIADYEKRVAGGGEEPPGGRPPGGDPPGDPPGTPGPSEQPPDGKGTIQRPVSRDPNDIIGPGGVGALSHVNAADVMPYTIRFENDAVLATAPAAMVRITQDLDPDLDWTTFRLGDFGFGSTVIDVPADSAFFETRLDLTATRGVYLDVNAGINAATGQVFWEFTSIDPATGDLPEDPLVGFLPPNVNGPEGEGFVTYSIQPKATAATGDRIDAQASIVFDVNDPIETPAIFNTLDGGAPSSQVEPIPEVADTEEFPVNWGGLDDEGGSGIAGYDVYVRTDGGGSQLWLSGATGTSAVFEGQFGHSYAFYSIATDSVGHREAAPALPDATITLPDAFIHTLDPAARAGRWSFPDADGDIVTVSLTGKGATATALRLAEEGQLGDLLSITIDSGDPKAALTFTVRKAGEGDGTTTIGDIEVNGSLRSLTGSAASLAGDLIVTGLLGRLRLDDVAGGHHILLNTGGLAVGPRDAVTVTLDRVADTRIETNGLPIGSLTITEWLSADPTDGGDELADEIVAPSIGRITTKVVKENLARGIVGSAGDFQAGLTLSGEGLAARKATLGGAKIAGAVNDSEWKVNGDAGVVTIAGLVDGWTLEGAGVDGAGLVNVKSLTLGEVQNGTINAAGVVKAVKALNWIGGSITADSLASLTVTSRRETKLLAGLPGDFRDATLTLLGNAAPARRKATIIALGSAKIAGSLVNSAWAVDMDAGAVTVGGEVNGWTLAGADDGDGVDLLSVKSLKLGDVADASVMVKTAVIDVLDAEGQAVAVTAGGVLGAVKALRWTAGSIEANSLASLTVTGRKQSRTADEVLGDFGADVTLHGLNLAARKPAAGAVKIANDLAGSNWMVGSEQSVNGSMKSLTVGHIASASIVCASGDIAALTLGACEGSTFLAGVKSGQTDPQQVTAVGDLNTTAKIGKVTIKGWKVGRNETPPPFLDGGYFLAPSFGMVSLLNAEPGTWDIFAQLGPLDLQIKRLTLKDTRYPKDPDRNQRWTPGMPSRPGGVGAMNSIP